MLPRVLPALVVLLLLAAGAPPAAAAHGQDAEAKTLVAKWRAERDAAVAGLDPRAEDRGLVSALQQTANRTADTFMLTAAAADLSAAQATALYVRMVEEAPADDKTPESRRAQRLWWLNESEKLLALADENLSAARAALKAYTPRTADGLERGVLAGRILASAHSALVSDYPGAKSRLESFTSPEPDTTIGVYRTQILNLVRFTEGSRIATARALEVLDRAKAADAAGEPVLFASGRAEVVEKYTKESSTPRTTGPNQLSLAFRARDAFAGGETLLGFGSFLLFDEVRILTAYESRRDNGNLNAEEGRAIQRAAYAAAEASLNETTTNGFPGLVLRDAEAFPVAVDALVSAARLEAARNLHTELLRMAVPSDAPTGLGPYVVAAIAVAVVATGAVVMLRRRG